MNVLLTGRVVYIGSHTAVVLSKLGHQTVLCDSLSNSKNAVIVTLVQVLRHTYLFIKGDVRYTAWLGQVLVFRNFDAVNRLWLVRQLSCFWKLRFLNSTEQMLSDDCGDVFCPQINSHGWFRQVGLGAGMQLAHPNSLTN